MFLRFIVSSRQPKFIILLEFKLSLGAALNVSASSIAQVLTVGNYLLSK